MFFLIPPPPLFFFRFIKFPHPVTFMKHFPSQSQFPPVRHHGGTLYQVYIGQGKSLFSKGTGAGTMIT